MLNPRQRAIVRIGLVLVLVMSLFPPWRGQVHLHQGLYDLGAGYAFLFAPPEGGRLPNGTGVRFDSSPYINLQLLVTQWAVVLVLAALAASFLGGQERPNR